MSQWRKTLEVKKWRGLSQSEIDQSWKNLAGRLEEEVLDKYKVEESNKEACRDRGAPLESRQGAQKQEILNKKVVENTAEQEFCPCLENTTCSVSKANRKSCRKMKR